MSLLFVSCWITDGKLWLSFHNWHYHRQEVHNVTFELKLMPVFNFSCNCLKTIPHHSFSKHRTINPIVNRTRRSCMSNVKMLKNTDTVTVGFYCWILLRLHVGVIFFCFCAKIATLCRHHFVNKIFCLFW